MMTETQTAGSVKSTFSLSPLAVPFKFSSNSALGFAQDPYGSNIDSLSSLNLEDVGVDYLHHHYDIPVGSQEQTCFSHFFSVEVGNSGDYDMGDASNSDLLTSKEVPLPMYPQGFENLGVAASFGGNSSRKETYAGGTFSNDSLLKGLHVENGSGRRKCFDSGDHVAGGLNSCQTSDCITGKSAAISGGGDAQLSQDQVQKDYVSTPSVIPSCQGVLAKVLTPSVDSCAEKFKAIPETQLCYPPCVVSGRKFDLYVSPEDGPTLQADSYKGNHSFCSPEKPSASVIAVEKSSSMLDLNESDLDSPCWKGTGIKTPGSLSQSFEPGQSQRNNKEKAVRLNPLAPEFLPRSVEGKENSGNDIVQDCFLSLLDSSPYHKKISFGECEPFKVADVEPCPFDLKQINDVVKKTVECESKCGSGMEKPTANNSLPDDCIQETCINKALTCVSTTSMTVGDSDSDSLNSHRHGTVASPSSDVSGPGHWEFLKNEKTNRLNPLASEFVPAAAGGNSYMYNEHPKDGFSTFQIISSPSPINISSEECGLSKTKMKTNSYGSNVKRIEYTRDNHDREKETMIQHSREDNTYVSEKASSVCIDEKRSSVLNSTGRSQLTSFNDFSTFNEKPANVRYIGDSLQGMEEALQVDQTVASPIATYEAGAGSIGNLIKKLPVLPNSMSSSWNAHIQNVIAAMGVLSELLVQNYSLGSDLLSDSQSDIIQHIINNLTVFRKNHCGQQNVMAEAVHLRSQYCVDKSTNLQVIREGIGRDVKVAEDDKMQASVFRNLWLDTEAEMCMRKFETYLWRMKGGRAGETDKSSLWLDKQKNDSVPAKLIPLQDAYSVD